MKKCFFFLLVAAALATTAGCGGNEKDRGKNSQGDRPQPTGSAKE